MRNLVKKIVCVLLACIFSFSLIGCSSNDKDGDVPQIEIADFERFTEGRHQFTYTETSNKIVENGKSDYVVVISQNADIYIKEAAEMQVFQIFRIFCKYFLKTRGCKIGICLLLLCT